MCQFSTYVGYLVLMLIQDILKQLSLQGYIIVPDRKGRGKWSSQAEGCFNYSSSKRGILKAAVWCCLVEISGTNHLSTKDFPSKKQPQREMFFFECWVKTELGIWNVAENQPYWPEVGKVIRQYLTPVTKLLDRIHWLLRHPKKQRTTRT